MVPYVEYVKGKTLKVHQETSNNNVLRRLGWDAVTEERYDCYLAELNTESWIHGF